MAKRSYSRKGNKIQPAVQTMSFVTPGSGAASVYIDLSQAASLANRRFYRQGINWAVAGIKVISLQPGSVNCFKLPNTWIMSNAWEKSFRTWTKMNKEAMEEVESIRPKFLDFKVYMDAPHHASGFGANLLPLSPFGGATVAGEWESSKVVVPMTDGSDNTRSRELIAVGANYPGTSPATGLDAVSMIEGYAASRGLPDVLDPNTPNDAQSVNGFNAENWMAAMFNEGTDQTDAVITDMVSENNIAPYPFENDGIHTDTMYPGGANQMSGVYWHDSVQIFSSSGVAAAGVGTQRIKGGNFPCGLIRLDWQPDEQSANLVIQVDLVPGNHRGYLCEPMTEM